MSSRPLEVLQFLGPDFQPTTSSGVATALGLSVSRATQILRETVARTNTVYRLGPNLWAITGKGQAVLGLEKTADKDCVAYLSIICDVLADGVGDQTISAIDTLKWFNWLAVPNRFRKKAALGVSVQIASHPWIATKKPRERAWSAYLNTYKALPRGYRKQATEAVQRNMTVYDFNWWREWARRRHWCENF